MRSMVQVLLLVIMTRFTLAAAPCFGAAPSSAPKRSMTAFRGVNLTSWQSGELSSPNAARSLDQLRRTNVNAVAVVVTWYARTSTSDSIAPHASGSPTEQDVRSCLRALHQRGYHTLLKPHVDVLDGSWRGTIQPKHPDVWFSSYRRYVLRMARLAEELHVEVFVVGTELKAISGSQYRRQWKDLLRAVRRTYHGHLTYAANWDEYAAVSFWGELDLLGIDAYFPLSTAHNPTLAELVRGWSRWIPELEALHRRYGKPILLTEIGYTSWDYAARRPWEYVGRHSYNGELQARCYEAVIRVTARESWIAGVFFWNWEPRPIDDARGKCTLSPQGKPAMRILQRWR